jgi:hypothetical protein
MANKSQSAQEAQERGLQVVQQSPQQAQEVSAALSTTQLGMIPLDTAERLLVMGDLSQLTPQERLLYYQQLCRSLGLNPVSRPFEYLYFQGKLSLYATKEGAAQLRTQRQVSFTKLETKIEAGLCIVSVEATLPDGRSDMDEGITPIQGLSGNELANARLKAITKAKRRVTLSICGLGMLDETEVDTMSGAGRVDLKTVHTQQEVVDGVEYVHVVDPPPPPAAKAPAAAVKPQREPRESVPQVELDVEAQELVARFGGLWRKLEAEGVPSKELWAKYAEILPDRTSFTQLSKELMATVIEAFVDLQASLAK